MNKDIWGVDIAAPEDVGDDAGQVELGEKAELGEALSKELAIEDKGGAFAGEIMNEVAVRLACSPEDVRDNPSMVAAILYLAAVVQHMDETVAATMATGSEHPDGKTARGDEDQDDEEGADLAKGQKVLLAVISVMALLAIAAIVYGIMAAFGGR